MNRTWWGCALLVWAVVSVACDKKGPTPGEPTAAERLEVTMAEREGSPAPSGAASLGIPVDDYHRDYGSDLHGSPHKPGGDLGAPESHRSGPVGRVDVGGLSFQAPQEWRYQHPTSSMRRAEFGVGGEEGSAGLVVYFFGNRGAGSAQANIERWVGQFKKGDGSPLDPVEPMRRNVAGLQVTQVEAAGTYVGGMGSGSAPEPEMNQRMVASIVETPSGPFYFKFLGDDAVVESNRKAFESLLSSMALSRATADSR